MLTLPRILLFVAAVLAAPVLAQVYTAANLPTNELLSEPGPTFQFADSELPRPLTLIAYGIKGLLTRQTPK